jgi:Co/Zn/Cd efflux system component
MAGCCHDDHCSDPKALNSPHWRRALWIVLAINASMFLAEVVAGVAAGSASLQTAWHAYAGTLPRAKTMGVVGVLALLADGGIALMLYRFRTGDANMRSVWICSRNDVMSNLAVLTAAAGVFGIGTAWPDLIVATTMAVLSVSAGWQIVRYARAELYGPRFTTLGAARRSPAESL